MYYIEILRHWFSDPLYNPILNLITIVILAITAIIGFINTRKVAESNELGILPLLIIKPTGKQMNNRGFFIKNIGNGTAYDIKIEGFAMILTDIQRVWELLMTIKGVAVMEPNEKKILHCSTFQDGKKSSIEDFLIFHLDPEEEHDREPVSLFITFRNAQGKKYYSKIETGKNGLNITIPPRKLFVKGRVLIFYSRLRYFITLNFYKIFLWKVRKPFIKQSNKNK